MWIKKESFLYIIIDYKYIKIMKGTKVKWLCILSNLCKIRRMGFEKKTCKSVLVFFF